MTRARPILVVDDDADIRETLGHLLSEEGYAVDTASDGTEALAKLRAGERPCLILLDLMMPRMNGWQFREEQERDPAIAGLPVCVISALADVGADARQLGVEYLAKPLDLGELLALLGRHCGKSR